MTDARLPGRWLLDPALETLSDKAWRVLTNALMLSNEQGTDGVIPQRSLRLLHVDGVDGFTAQELIGVNFWRPDDSTGGGFIINDWTKTQTLAEDAEWQRTRNRMNQAAKRKREREKVQAKHSAVTGDVPEYALGQDRTGKDRLDTEGVTPVKNNVLSWPTVQVPA